MCIIKNIEKKSHPFFAIFRPPYKWILQGMEFYNKFVDGFKDLSKKSFVTKGKV